MSNKRTIPTSELIINGDGSVFHLHLRPEQPADRVFLVGDPARVDMVASRFDSIECNVSSREFHTITGSYKGKRISIVSHGIGTDNIDIVLNELDALSNIDFETRQEKDTFRQLTLVRVGTSGGLQDETPIGTYVAAEHSIGFDGVIYFYSDTARIRNPRPSKKLSSVSSTGRSKACAPTSSLQTRASSSQICQDDILRGNTIAANGFYGPQGRQLRLPLQDPKLNEKIQGFNFEGYRLTNYETGELLPRWACRSHGAPCHDRLLYHRWA